MKYQSRNYQADGKLLTIEALKENRSTLGVCATGGGKTVIAADIIIDYVKRGKRVMFIAHRKELVFQAKKTIESIVGCHVAIEMGDIDSCENSHDIFAGGKAMVVISSVQTQTAGGDGFGRLGKFNPMEFELLIIDEAHHATSDSYQKIISYYCSNPDLKILGLTATPDRNDEEALGQVFDTVAFNYDMEFLIKEGWLVPLDGEYIEIESLDFSGIRTTAGDLNGSDLAALMESEKNLHGVASATIQRTGDKRGIGFAASVDQARIISDIFNRNGIKSHWICGKTPDIERSRTLEKFTSGDIQWMWNCGVFTEGFDETGVEVIAQARPTKSRALYAQMAGRGTRPHVSIAGVLANMKVAALRRAMIKRSVKPGCYILDFVGNSGRHDLMSIVDILGGNTPDKVMKAAKEFMRKNPGKHRVEKTIEELEKELAEREEKRLRDAARKHNVVGKAKFSVQKFDPFTTLGIKPQQPRGWDKNKTLSEKQRNVLRKAKYDPDKMPYAQAAQLVSIIISRWNENKCSIKQAELLRKFGCDTEVSFANAKIMLDQIQKNNWRRPERFEGLQVDTQTTQENVDTNSNAIDDEVPF